jgi:acetylornithine aminotransferase
MDGLKEKLKGHPHVKAIRGKGLMIGVELDRPCREILSLAVKKGLLFNIANENVIRLLPALIFQEEHVNQLVNTIPMLIDEFYGRG